MLKYVKQLECLMDKRIEKKAWGRRNAFRITIVSAFILWAMFYLIFRDKSSKLKVDSAKVTFGEVINDKFEEYISQIGTVAPILTVYLDAIEGGRVEEIQVEKGCMVEKDQVILRLSNPNLNLSILNSEANLAEQMNFLRNTRLAMEQEKLRLKEQMLDIKYKLQKQERLYKKNKLFYEQNIISEEEYLVSKEEYEYLYNMNILLLEKEKTDSMFRSVQIKQFELNLERMQENLDLVRNKLENLNVKAPIAGQLGALNAEIGEAKKEGQRLGVINDLQAYKVKVSVDEYYIDRITEEQQGKLKRNNEEFKLKVKRIYPEVKNGRFDIDMVFNGAIPDNIRTGQTYRLIISLGQSEEAIIIPKGGFYQSTGGQWVYVLNENGTEAIKRSIRLGNQNPMYFEVLEGLKQGETIITSGYDDFGDVDKIIFN